MTNFEKFDQDFRDQNLTVFNNNPSGLLWLKVRAISRKTALHKFIQDNNITLKSQKVKEQTIELFEYLEKQENPAKLIDGFLKQQDNEWYKSRGVDIEQLKEDLYKVQSYVWGGDQNNSLDKFLVKHYVKDLPNFDALQLSKDKIGNTAWNYVQNSWYNNWTSFLIESCFKTNKRVTSAVGEIKSVDFFIDNYPIDLKVTYFPKEFMELKLKPILGKYSLPWLKSKCKSLGITCDSKSSTEQQQYTLCEKLQVQGHSDILNELNSARNKVIADSRKNPVELIKWLYEQQGTMRFGAENRIFLIVVDTNDLTQSWKLKRAFTLIETKINEYLDNFTPNSLKPTTFQFNKKNYSALSDAIFVTNYD